MKLFIFAALTIAGSASAATYYQVGFCGNFSEPFTTTPPNSGSGTWVCPSAAALGITGPLSVAGEFIVYDSDYSSGLSPTVTTATNWGFSGVTAAWASDTTTVTGTNSSNSNVSSQGAPFNPLTNAFGPTVLAGFYDTVSGFGTPTINWTTQATVGDALSGTGYAEVVYAYNVTDTGAPEPLSMLLAATGLLLVFAARTKPVRRLFSRI
jgi:hypothetical protein